MIQIAFDFLSLAPCAGPLLCGFCGAEVGALLVASDFRFCSAKCTVCCSEVGLLTAVVFLRLLLLAVCCIFKGFLRAYRC